MKLETLESWNEHGTHPPSFTLTTSQEWLRKKHLCIWTRHHALHELWQELLPCKKVEYQVGDVVAYLKKEEPSGALHAESLGSMPTQVFGFDMKVCQFCAQPPR